MCFESFLTQAGIQVDLKPTLRDASVQCAFPYVAVTSTPKKHDVGCFTMSESDISDVEGDQPVTDVSAGTYCPSEKSSES